MWGGGGPRPGSQQAGTCPRPGRLTIVRIVTHRFLPVVLCALMALLTACSSSPASSSPRHTTVSTTGGSTLTYNTRPQDVLIRTFYGGSRLGSREMSPDVTTYGD